MRELDPEDARMIVDPVLHRQFALWRLISSATVKAFD